MQKAIIEALKEAGRIALFAAIAAVIGWATTQVSSWDPNSTYYIVATVLIRLADKYVHENKDIKADGIAPF